VRFCAAKRTIPNPDDPIAMAPPIAPIDILILSNGPGEVSTWVRPVVRSLRALLGHDRDRLRISLILAPDSNGTGQEQELARRYPEIDRIQAAKHFFPFLLQGKTLDQWDWRDRGCVIFLGGDQFFPIVIARRLGYKTLVYCEWDARWPRWHDRFAVMSPKLIAKAVPEFQDKYVLVGDLTAEVGATQSRESIGPSRPDHDWVAILPGSKAAKLTMGLPFMLAVAADLHRRRPQTRFFIPVAPTIDSDRLFPYSQPETNSFVPIMGGPEVRLVKTAGQLDRFETASGLRVELDPEFPAYDRLAQMDLCLTTIGANTAELGSLGLPMVVVLPTQQLDAMRAWDGLPGLLANLPGVGSFFAKAINRIALRNLGWLAWPNTWADRAIVPEFVGELKAADVAAAMAELLGDADRLAEMRRELRSVRGEPGAAAKIAELVAELVAD
jgi:hypothetical protein